MYAARIYSENHKLISFFVTSSERKAERFAKKIRKNSRDAIMTCVTNVLSLLEKDLYDQDIREEKIDIETVSPSIIKVYWGGGYLGTWDKEQDRFAD